MNFGFIAHVNNQDERNMLKCMNQINHLLSNMSVTDIVTHTTKDSVDFVEFSVTSKMKVTCKGKITYLPWYPQDILENSEDALAVIKKIALDLEEWGAEIIGLGGYTAAIGGRGVEIQKALKKAKITTGNSFTASTSIDTLNYIQEKLKFSISDKIITVVGFPGSIALVVTKAMSHTGAKIQVVGRRANIASDKFLSDLTDEEKSRVTFTTSLNEALENSDIVFSATTTGWIIHQDVLKPGAIVIDIGEPKDMMQSEFPREDILVVDGGRFGFANDVVVDLPFSDFVKTNFFGCVGETILLALENDLSHCSIGRILTEENVEAIKKLGCKHGFIVDGLSNHGSSIDDNAIYKLSRYYEESRTHSEDIYININSADKDVIFDKYKDHVNSVLVSLSKTGNYDRLYIRAEGLNVWDSEGEMYFDFVGGYGSVNIGHNHPCIVDGIKKYLEISPPSLLQVSPGYFASILSERLTNLFPGKLNRVFFCNSGAESVEGALKLARIYTGKYKYISTNNSFHGKTYGALSVTGREKYQRFFKPLLDGVDFVEYGNIDEIEALLQNNDIAAVIIEPIQGEGGVIIPPKGYLKRCLELCHSHGALLIVDEVQTGFGRTGKMFGFEHDEFIPDIVTVAKSLGGSLIPIGAYITQDEIWGKAYGSQEKYLLHTSTFGGNSFCSSVAINAIDIISKENLAENAKNMGQLIMEGLTEISRNYNFIKDVRGCGLLIGIEFKYSLDNGISNLIKVVGSMVPNRYKDFFSAFPRNILDSITDFIEENTVNVEKFLSENFASQFSACLLNDFNIITIVTLNNPNIIRIEPPLVITENDVQYFLDGFRAVCEKFRFLDEDEDEEL